MSAASDLVQGDTNGYQDVFVRDIEAKTTTLASIGPAMLTPYTMYQSESPVISADGRRVAFMASVHGLVASHRTLQWTILLRDLENAQTYWVSTNVTDFTGGNPVRCYNPAINEDGTWVAFKAQGGLLLRHHVDTIATEIVSTNAVDYGDVVEDLSGPSMSPDGRFIAYAGQETPGALSQIHRWDAGTGDTVLISVNLEGDDGNGISDTPRVSADGGEVLFLSHATDLVGIGTDGSSQLYLRDVAAGATRLLSLNPAAQVPAIHDVSLHWMNAKGDQVVFDLFDDALVAGDRNRLSDVFGVNLEAGTLDLFSTGFPGNRSSTAAGPSAPATGGVSVDGRYIAFVSSADDLVPNDANGFADVFLRDLEMGTTVLVSVNTAGASGNGASSRPVVSADGQQVAFESLASDLVANDLNSMPDVFVRDLVNGTTILASVKLDGTGSADLGATTPAISGNGRQVAFVSSSLDIAQGARLPGTRVFVRDLQSGETILVGRDLQFFLRWSYDQPVLSTDGSAVVFQAPYISQTRLLRTVLSTGITQRLDAPLEGTLDPSQFISKDAVLSADGRRVAFMSDHPGLVSGDSNNKFDLFVTDLETGMTRLITLNTNGISGNGDALDAVISADGRWVAFTSLAGDLVPHDPNRGPGVQGLNRDRDVFLHHLETGATTLVSRGSRENRSGNGPSDQPTISGDGRYVAYRSRASDLVAGDTNGQSDVFVYDRITGITALASTSAGSWATGNRPSFRPLLSPDGSILVFGSHASDLIHSDYNEATDIFWSPIPLDGGLNSFAAELSVTSTDRVTVRWRPTGVGAYALEYRDELTIGDWRQVEAAMVIEDGWARVVDVLPQGVRQRFYRVAFAAQPQ